jgi:hypothetical protein
VEGPGAGGAPNTKPPVDGAAEDPAEEAGCTPNKKTLDLDPEDDAPDEAFAPLTAPCAVLSFPLVGAPDAGVSHDGQAESVVENHNKQPVHRCSLRWSRLAKVLPHPPAIIAPPFTMSGTLGSSVVSNFSLTLPACFSWYAISSLATSCAVTSGTAVGAFELGRKSVRGRNPPSGPSTPRRLT